MSLTGEKIRQVLLEVVSEQSSRGSGFQESTVLRETARRLNIRQDRDAEQALLTLWNDLYRSGIISWGHNLANASHPFCHLTDRARRFLENMSRDPGNPDGYMNHLLSTARVDEVALSYIREALAVYNSNCFKAAAVMVGCASESLVLGLRDSLTGKMRNLKRAVPKKLDEWRIRTVLTAMHSEIEQHKQSMDNDLKENFESYWPAITQQIRSTRNDAGHPTNITAITPERVQISLLLLPELATMTNRLSDWINTAYS